MLRYFLGSRACIIVCAAGNESEITKSYCRLPEPRSGLGGLLIVQVIGGSKGVQILSISCNFGENLVNCVGEIMNPPLQVRAFPPPFYLFMH